MIAYSVPYGAMTVMLIQLIAIATPANSSLSAAFPTTLRAARWCVVVRAWGIARTRTGSTTPCEKPPARTLG